MSKNDLKFYIYGEWVAPVVPKPCDVINPTTEEVAGQISLGSAADVERAVAAARHAFPSYSTTSREERIAPWNGSSRATRRAATNWRAP
jgi:aldehyde dehydrogenase (NAD+)